MKRKLLAFILVGMIMTTLLAGCSNKSGGTTTTEPSASYDWKEYMELADYKELPYYTEEFEVTDEEVDEEIERLLLYATDMETITEGVVEDGDNINVAFVGKIDGEEFDGGSSESYDITVGTTSMIDGFVEGLIGKKIGETVTLNLRFPDDYHSTELQGKDVVFDVTINSKSVSKTPELTDEFVKTNYEAENVAAFKEQIKADLLEGKKTAFDSQIKNELWSVIVEKTEIKNQPEEEVAKAQTQVEQMETEYKNMATNYGLEWEDFLTTMMGMTEESFKAQMDEYTANIVKSNMITSAIAKEEGITLSESAYKERIQKILDDNNLTEEAFEGYYQMSIYDYAEQNGWRDSILMDMVIDRIMELGKEVPMEEYEAFISEQLPAVEEEHDHDHEHDHEHKEEEAEEENAEG